MPNATILGQNGLSTANTFAQQHQRQQLNSSGGYAIGGNDMLGMGLPGVGTLAGSL